MTLSSTALSLLSDRNYSILLFHYLHLRYAGRLQRLNLRTPRTFNEKTIWLKLYHQLPNASLLADKVRVKAWVSAQVGPEHVVPTLGVWKQGSDIDFASLPESFVLKTNHGSGWNIVCVDKSELNISKAAQKIDRWLSTNYGRAGREYQYESIEPLVLAEPLLRDGQDGSIVDYKLFCFDGTPRYVQVDLDRFTNHTRVFYDLEWNNLKFTTLYPIASRPVARPRLLDQMIAIAQKLSVGIPFVRVDLYATDTCVFFGEMTLHHGGGFEPFTPRAFDRVLGDQIRLPLEVY